MKLCMEACILEIYEKIKTIPYLLVNVFSKKIKDMTLLHNAEP